MIRGLELLMLVREPVAYCYFTIFFAKGVGAGPTKSEFFLTNKNRCFLVQKTTVSPF